MPSSGELSSLIEFIDEFIFSAVAGSRGGKGQGKGGKSPSPRRLTSLQQLQLIQVILILILILETKYMAGSFRLLQLGR